eukprot:NODE_506_length_2140_cov_19.086935_g468_i0.p1 GENE.NODE_506_length_2140_cov_19.086935_g468_i0~~NODE_506_length_2140_cov_19.086935_g468_i0.p1  ORF type:complete len:689 (+),score=197.90 NODE_506_length_2140_cov_19.086935_g468_i0:47-2068(+)
MDKEHPMEEEKFGQIFMSWIKDTHEEPSRENFIRLQEIVNKGCNEKQFVVRSQRLGVNTALTIARLLDRTPVEKIDVYENVVRDHGAQALSQLIRDSRSLTSVNLGGNDIGPLGCLYIAALLPTNKKLKVLILGSEDGDLHTNKIDSDSGKALAEGLSKNKTIRWLDLNRNPLGRDSQEVFYAFAKVLEKNPVLTTVKLGATYMNTLSAICLIKGITTSQTLELLDLHENDLQPPAAESLSDLISPKQGHPSPLTTLLLQNNTKLRAKGLIPFFKALKTNSVLTTLNLRNTGFGDEGASYLADALVQNATLVYLDLTHNDINVEGCIGICSALRTNTSVQFLGFSDNLLKDDGACAMANTLEHNHTLTSLEMGACRCCDRGAIALGMALAHNQGLQGIKLNDNHISDEAGLAFAELLEKNTKLLSIDIRGNQVSHSTLLRVKKVVKKNKALRDGEIPNQLQQEVIRLHFQHYKLQEANNELKDHQKARIELQDLAERTERDATVEKENTAKRSKEIIEKILMVENFCEELRSKQKLKEEESTKGSQQFEVDLKILQEKLKQETGMREARQVECDEMEAKNNKLQTERESRMASLTEQIDTAKKERENWLEKNKSYRAQAQEAQERISNLEKMIRERQTEQAIEPGAEADKKIKKKAKKRAGNADALIDSLLGV